MSIIKDLDHTVFTVSSIDEISRFYVDVLGMEKISFKAKVDLEIDPDRVRTALVYGNKKINLHQEGSEMEPYARNPKVGSQDLCFVLDDDISLEDAIVKIQGHGLKILGPRQTTGAQGPMRSFYFRDPDGNLVELAKY